MHPFWTKSRGWVNAEQLSFGEDGVTLAGGAVAFDRPLREERLQTVYNLEVEDFHSYFVGREAVLVHNGARCLYGLKSMDPGISVKLSTPGIGKTKEHAKVLRQALKAANMACPEGVDKHAHHVVPSGMRFGKRGWYASRLRGLLGKYRIDFNDWINGACVPGSCHGRYHKTATIVHIYKALSTATLGLTDPEQIQEKLAEELRKIADKMENCQNVP